MSIPEQKVRLRGSAQSDTGRIRDNNEDSVHFWASADNQMVLAVVADGMGGAVAGEEASRITIDTIRSGLLNSAIKSSAMFSDMKDDILIENLKETIRRANVNIVDQSIEHPELKGMGTTVTLAFIRDTNVIIGHVGDSRAYHIDSDDGYITQITSDHSFVQALVAAGHITEDEAEEHPMRNVLYRALGQSYDVEVDSYTEVLHVGDRLVLCSDGLTLHVKPGEISQIVLAEKDPTKAGKKLIDLANTRGGRDNVSVIVIAVEELMDPKATVTNHKVTEVAPEASHEDDDTLILTGKRGFAPADSTLTAQREPRDTLNNYQRSGSSVAPLTEKIPHEDIPGLPGEASPDTVAEGRDPQTPDQ